MQTFLPYPNFVASAMTLDRQRLGKQRVEARQIQTTLQELERGRTTGWSRHPAVRMWEGHVEALMLYSDCVIREWMRRGYENNMPLMLANGEDEIYECVRSIRMPPWLGREDFHRAHRCVLMRKDPDWYRQFGWDEWAGEEYVWPTLESNQEK